MTRTKEQPPSVGSWRWRLASLASGLRGLASGLPHFLAYGLYERLSFGRPDRFSPETGKGRRALVVLNGSSLAGLDPQSLADGDIFVCNDFCRTPLFKELKPRYYVLADQQYYAGSISPTGEPVKAASLGVLSRDANWPIDVFLPLDGRAEGMERFLDNACLRRLHYAKAPLPGGDRLSRWLLFHSGAMPYVANVSIAMIALAIKLGYDQIDVYGLDMSFYRNFRVDEDNMAFITNSYFYDKENFEPFMVSSKAEGGYVRGNARIFFERMYQTLDSHWNIARMTRNRVRIVNHSGDSVIDCYERGA